MELIFVQCWNRLH